MQWQADDGIMHYWYPADESPEPPMWEACEYPERPPEAHLTMYRIGCRPCAVAAEARARCSGLFIDRLAADQMWAELGDGE